MMQAMISMVQPLPIGNALRLFLQPPSGSVRWRVLRKATPDIDGVDDATALVAYEGTERLFMDSMLLPNGEPAHYVPFYLDASNTWAAGPGASGTPAATYEDLSTDALNLVRDRLEAGLQVEVQRGNIVNDLGYVQAFTAPPLADNVHFPVVTVHVESEQPSERFIGEDVMGDAFDAIGFDWAESEGWIADVRLQIIGWCLNADERAELRRAIRRVVVGNLPVFSGHGLDQVTLQQSDVDAMNGEFGVPQMFQTINSFSCVAPVRVAGRVPAIRDVTVTSQTIN